MNRFEGPGGRKACTESGPRRLILRSLRSPEPCHAIGSRGDHADARRRANWPEDWSWWAADPPEGELSDETQTFFESKGIDSHGNRFTLDGNSRGTHSTALVATNAVASLAVTDRERAAKFVEALWQAAIRY